MSELERASRTEVVCGLVESRCHCVRPPGHDGLHACKPECGGSWGWDEDGRFVVGSLPGAWWRR